MSLTVIVQILGREVPWQWIFRERTHPKDRQIKHRYNTGVIPTIYISIKFRNFASCPPLNSSLNGAIETWPRGRRRAPAKGVGPWGSRGFESLRLCHPPCMAIWSIQIRGLVVRVELATTYVYHLHLPATHLERNRWCDAISKLDLPWLK